ncbi:unnamed protein product [Camellia sinensis]
MMGLLIGYTYFVFLHHRHDLHPPQHRFWEQRRALAGIKAAGNQRSLLKVGILRCQVRTHPPSDGLHFIVMGANQLPNKGPAPELTLFEIFGFEREDIPNSGLNFVSMPEDFNMQNSQPPYSPFWRSPGTAQNQTVQLRDFVLEAVHEIQETRIVDSDLEVRYWENSSRVGQSHATHDDDQLVAQYQPVLGATFEDLLNTCQHLPSGPAEDFTRPTNSNGFGLEDQDDHLFTGRSNQQLPLSEELSWSPENFLAELNLPFVTEGPAVQTSQLPYSGFILVFEGYISKPESPNPKQPTSSEEFYCENNTLVAQGLLFPGGNIDNLWNKNKPFPSEKEYLVEPPEKLKWIGDFGFLAQEPWPGNIFVELELPPVHEGPGLPNPQLPGSGGLEQLPGCISIPGLPNSQLPSSSEEFYFQNHTQVAQGPSFVGGIMPLPSFGDHYNQTFPPPLVETSYTSLDAPLINNGNSNGADLGLPPPCKKAKLCSKGKDQRRPYNKFSPDETNKLIEGVQKYARMYGCWIKIKNEYFKNDPHRTSDNLKQKWKHMMRKRSQFEEAPYKVIANKNAKFKSSKCKQGLNS